MKQTKITEVPGLLRVGIYLFDKVELLDFAGPYEVFSVTSELNDFGMFQVFTLSYDGRPIQTISGLKVIVDYSFDNHPPIDLLVIPGGVGTRSEVKKPHVLDWIKRVHRQNQITMSVCSGSILLGKAGLLDGLSATTHWRSLEWMRELFPDVTVEHDKRVVEDGRIITSAGISAGIDMALRVVARYYGEGVARATAKHMEYPYPEDNTRRVNI